MLTKKTRGPGPTRLLHAYAKFGHSRQSMSTPPTHLQTRPQHAVVESRARAATHSAQLGLLVEAPHDHIAIRASPSLRATFIMDTRSNDTQLSTLLHLNPDLAQLNQCLRLTGIRKMTAAGVVARHRPSMAGSACGEGPSSETKGNASVAVAR